MNPGSFAVPNATLRSHRHIMCLRALFQGEGHVRPSLDAVIHPVIALHQRSLPLPRTYHNLMKPLPSDSYLISTSGSPYFLHCLG